ncbi:MAG: cytochrome c oxidase assembly protein, partial [Brevundimonas sp.]
MTRPNFIKLTDEQVRARKRRNVAIALGLVGFIILVFVVTVTNLQRNTEARPGAAGSGRPRTGGPGRGADAVKDRKNLVALICAAVVMGMTGAAFAAVPLYRLFCQVTGFDGTVKKAEAAPTQILDRSVLIRFDTNVRDLPMSFKAEQTTQRVRIGETGMAYFNVTNTSDQPIHATAAYNVV